MNKSLLLCFLAFLSPSAFAESGEVMLDAWLQQQSTIKTWRADVLQTRKLKSIKHALETPGKIWFVRPNQFRWQLGEPPRTLAIRNDEQLLIVYPRLKQAERYPFDSVDDPAMQQALLLLEVGLPSGREKFYAQYELLDKSSGKTFYRFDLQPKNKKAQRLLSQLSLEVSKTDRQLVATELIFPDGSIMRNSFSNHGLNVEVPPNLLDEAIDGYDVVEPLKKP